MNKKKAATLFVILAASMWGTFGVTVKVLSGFGFTAIQMVVARLIVSTVLLGAFLLITDKEKLRIKKEDIKWFLGTGIVSMLFYNTCYCQTISMTSLSIAAVLLYTSPIFVMLMSMVIFKEKLTLKKIVAMICSVIGCALVSGVLTNTAKGIPFAGVMFGIGAAFGYALYGIFAKILIKKYHSLTILFYTFLLAGIGGAFIGNSGGIIQIIMKEPISFLAILEAALVCGVTPYILYTTALKYLEASKVSIIASIEPVIATILGIVIFSEAITVTSIIGIICVLFAIVLLNWET